jgi:hypothetical protein
MTGQKESLGGLVFDGDVFCDVSTTLGPFEQYGSQKILMMATC